MSVKSDRRAAREAVSAYHEERVERFQAGEIDPFDVDELIVQYSRTAKELWKFCSLGNMEIAARIVRDELPIDWWERGARRRR